MKKLLKSTLLLTALSSALTAGTIFDLSAQHFSNSLDGEGVGARYDLPNVYVSTALKYTAGLYTPTTNRATQTMAVEIKTPPSNWSVSFDMSYYLYTKVHPIRLTSDTGKTITVSFAKRKISLNAESISEPTNFYYRKEITGTITKSGNTVTCQIAGYVTKTITVSNFSKLKFINVSLLLDHNEYNNYQPDYLNGLNISSF